LIGPGPFNSSCLECGLSMNSDAVHVNKCSDSDLLSVLERFESDLDIKEHELFHRCHAAILDALCDITKNGEEEEPPLMYLKDKDGSPRLSYNVVLRKRSVKCFNRLDIADIIRIGSGEFKLGFCRPEETATIEIEAKRAAWQHRDISNERLEKLYEHADTYPSRALESLFLLKAKGEPSEEVKDYFRGDDLAAETIYLNAELAERVRQVAYPPFPPEMSDEELAGIGYAWHLDDPEVARWRGVDPIPAFGPVYEFDFTGDPQKAAVWLLKDEDVKEFDEDGEAITVRTKISDVVIYLAGLQKKEPLEYARFAKKLAKILDISKKDFEAFLLKTTAIVEEPTPEVLLEDLPRIKDEADRIIAADMGFNYCVQSWNKSHHGDTPAGELLFVQRGIQCCSNSKGMHIHLRGESAAGKSDAASNFIKRTPKRLTIDADLTPRALYYAARGSEPGSVANVDDIQWTESLVNMFKRSTTAYQEGAELLTVVDGKPLKLKIPPRMSFIMSSVDSQADEQARDRTVAVDIDSSPARIEQIKSYMAAQAKKSHIQDAEEAIAICRAIISDLADHLWEAVIPFADRIEIDGETRAMAVFLDIVRGVCAWHYTKREQIETDYGFVLVATEADFYEAKRIYENVRGHSREKLSEKEIAILQAIVSQGVKGSIDGEAVRLLDYGGLQTTTKLPSTTIKDTLHGRHLGGGQRGYGLLAKISTLKYHDSRESIKLELPGGVKYSETKKLFFSLPESFQVSDSHEVFRELVRLRSE